MTDTTRIVSILALSNGDLALASERLELSPDDILTTISDDPTAQAQLIKAMSAKLLLDTYTRLQNISQLIDDEMSQDVSPYKPSDKLEALKINSEMFSNLLRNRNVPDALNVGNINVFERVLSSLPPDVRDAITVLTPPATNGTTPTPLAPAGVLHRIRAREDSESELG